MHRYEIESIFYGIIMLIPTCCAAAQLVASLPQAARNDIFSLSRGQAHRLYSVCALIPVKLASPAHITQALYCFVGAFKCCFYTALMDMAVGALTELYSERSEWLNNFSRVCAILKL